MIDKQTCQVLWVYGAMERLCTLGFIDNPGMQITQKAIDLFLLIDENREIAIDLFLLLDENREILFDKDEHFVSLVKLVCKDFDAQDDQVDDIVELVRGYKDNRTKLVQFSLANSL